MAIAAINAHACNMVFVAKMYGLINRHVDHAHIVDTVDIENDSQNTCHDQEGG
jgi:hypothetical protein